MANLTVPCGDFAKLQEMRELRDAGLSFLPLQEEHYDFAMPRTREQRPAVQAFQELLREESTSQQLRSMGFRR